MTIYVARHGQTQWNVENRICGRTDLPLTEEGSRQAELLGKKAAVCGMDLIIASPMLRARQTAEAVAKHCGVPVITDARLIEQDYGSFEGMSRFDEGFLANKRQFAVRYPGGESMMDLAARAYSLLDEIREKYPDKTVCLVCHGGICRVIRTYFQAMTNEEYFHYSPDNASLTKYEI